MMSSLLPDYPSHDYLVLLVPMTPIAAQTSIAHSPRNPAPPSSPPDDRFARLQAIWLDWNGGRMSLRDCSITSAISLPGPLLVRIQYLGSPAAI